MRTIHQVTKICSICNHSFSFIWEDPKKYDFMLSMLHKAWVREYEDHFKDKALHPTFQEYDWIGQFTKEVRSFYETNAQNFR